MHASSSVGNHESVAATDRWQGFLGIALKIKVNKLSSPRCPGRNQERFRDRLRAGHPDGRFGGLSKTRKRKKPWRYRWLDEVREEVLVRVARVGEFAAITTKGLVWLKPQILCKNSGEDAKTV